MVAHGRQTHLSGCQDDSDHGRRRRKQRVAVAVVEIRIAEIRRSDGVVYFGCHFPPGTSKWNKIEHRLFSFISSNWRGEPLRDYETVVKLIAKTTTAKG